MTSRRRFLAQALAAALAGPALARAADPAHRPAQDFDALWHAIDEGYAYLEDRPAWKAARARWRPRAVAARTRAELLAALEGVLAELRDDHVQLEAHNPDSPRPVPHGTDLWGEWAGNEAVIVAVRAGSVADVAGLAPGMRVAAVRGSPVEQAVRTLLPRAMHAEPRARDWALRRLLAGPWAGSLSLDVLASGRARHVEIEREDRPAGTLPPLIARRIGEERDLGYLRVKDNLRDAGLVAHFDAALQHLRNTRGLLVDLRETASGGEPEVARALLARFAQTPTPWIVRRPRADRHLPEARPERIAPRGPFTYGAPVAVLVDRWTAGEGESLAIGLEAVARATIVGTAMAGLRGQPQRIVLPASGLGVRFPAERVFHVNGTPREAIRPALPVDIVSPNGGPGDPILYQGLKLLDARPGHRPART